MRTFKKSSKLDNVLYDVRGPVVDEAARMEESGTQILKLNIGKPGSVRLPHAGRSHLRYASATDGMRRAILNAQGLFSARKAIMQYAQLKGIPNIAIEDIYTGNGVSELINICMSALLDDGDEISDPLSGLSAVDRLRDTCRRKGCTLHLR